MSQYSRRTVLVGLGHGVAVLTAGGAVLAWLGSSASPARRRGAATSFGTVSILGSSRLALAPAGAARHAAHRQVGHHAHLSDTPVPSAVHGAWTDAAVVDVEVHNGSRVPVELSPGQFRVRVDRGGPTVSLYSADRDAGPVAPGATAAVRISYLVPPPDRRLTLEFADSGASAPVRLGPVGHGAGVLS